MEVEEAVIADGDPVSISAQVLKNTFGAIEGGFAIDDPLLMIELVPEYLKALGLLEMADTAGEDKSIRLEASFEKVKELSSKQRRHHPYGNEKTFAAGDPAASFGGESTSGDNTVEVGMVHEVLTPSMENTDHSYRCTEMFLVLCEFRECLGGRAKKQIVQDPLVQ